MQQISGLLRDTWWLWVVCFVGIAVMGYFLSPVICVMYPVLCCMIVYFAYMRYDKDGKEHRPH